MMRNSTAWLVLIVVLICGGPVLIESDAADVFLESSRTGFQKIPVWIMGFGDGKGDMKADLRVGRETMEVLKADLTRSLMFDVLQEPPRPLEFVQAHCENAGVVTQAKESGATVSTWGRVGKKSHQLIMESCAYDGGRQDLALGKRYVGSPISMRLLRLMIHRWADELVSQYTGEKGIARTKIIFVSEDAKGNRDLYVMDYDGFGPKRVTADQKLSLMPSWSPDQRAIVYTTYRDHNQEIIHLTLESGAKKILVAPKSLNITPSYSPDGTLMAYSSASEGNSDIYTLNLKTQEVVQLTFHQSADLSPSWSPTGREIVFTSDRGGRPQIYLMSADGSNVRRLTFDGDYNAAPAWSPKGDWIAYVCQIPSLGFKLCRISPDGRERVQLTSGSRSEIDDSPSWSPDGRHLVFSSNRNGKSHIYMINFDGTSMEKLTFGGKHHSSPAWSPL